MLASFLFSDKKILIAATPKNGHYDCSNQEERRRDRTSAHKINVQSLTASVGEPQVVTPV